MQYRVWRCISLLYGFVSNGKIKIKYISPCVYQNSITTIDELSMIEAQIYF